MCRGVDSSRSSRPDTRLSRKRETDAADSRAQRPVCQVSMSPDVSFESPAQRVSTVYHAQGSVDRAGWRLFRCLSQGDDPNVGIATPHFSHE